MSAHRMNADEIVALEKKYWDLMQAGDYRGCVAMMTDRSVTVGSRGARIVDKEEYLRRGDTADWKLNAFRLSEEQVLFPSENVAIICYRADQDALVEGRPSKTSDLHMSTWVRTPQGWLAAAHAQSQGGEA